MILITSYIIYHSKWRIYHRANIDLNQKSSVLTTVTIPMSSIVPILAQSTSSVTRSHNYHSAWRCTISVAPTITETASEKDSPKIIRQGPKKKPQIAKVIPSFRFRVEFQPYNHYPKADRWDIVDAGCRLSASMDQLEQWELLVWGKRRQFSYSICFTRKKCCCVGEDNFADRRNTLNSMFNPKTN